jgi:Holliday junction resolvase RusA-like endonuclease
MRAEDTCTGTIARPGPAQARRGGDGGHGGRKPPAAATQDGPRRLVIEVDLPPRELCGNGRAHGFGRSLLVADQRKAATLAAYKALAASAETLKRPFFRRGVRVAVRVTVRRPGFWSSRKLDDPNLQHGLKGAIDGLARAGVWYDDSQHYFDGPIRWEAARVGEHGVTLELVEVAE